MLTTMINASIYRRVFVTCVSGCMASMLLRAFYEIVSMVTVLVHVYSFAVYFKLP